MKPRGLRLQLINRSMYVLKKPGFLHHDSTPSTCQVCEEFLQGYHELLQRVSRTSSRLSSGSQLNPKVTQEYQFSTEKKKVYGRQMELESKSNLGMKISGIFLTFVPKI